MALTVLRKRAADQGLARTLQLESAGTHAPSPAQPPDPRGLAALVRRGYKPEKKRSTRITASHFVDFDEILAMDSDNLEALQKMCPPTLQHKLALFLTYAPDTGRAEVPDPYFGNAAGFEVVLDLCEAAATGLVARYTL